jgi:hypothetical protein
MVTSFHETKMVLLNERDMYEKTRADHIDEMANDLYVEKLAALPNGQIGGSVYRARPGYNIESALGKLDGTDLIPLARAIIANDATEVGLLIIKLVTDQLRKDAQQEADDHDEETYNERRYGRM